MPLRHVDRQQDGEGTSRSIELRPNWRLLFEKYDLDKDGKISLSELQNLLRRESRQEEIPRHLAHRILKKADEDQNGYLDYSEFLKMTEQKEIKKILHKALYRYVSATIVQPRPTVELTPEGEVTYEGQHSCSPPRVLMIIISILQMTAYIWDVAFRESSEDMGPAMSIFIYNPYKRYEVWRYLTYMFVHFSIFHLVFNLLVQLVLGIPLEMVHGWWRVLLVYIAGVAAGSLGTSIANPTVYLGGASGGAYAIIAAHLATICMNWSEKKYVCLQLVIYLSLCMIDTGYAVYTSFVKGKQSLEGYPAHMAGAIAGLLVGINILRNLQWKSWEYKVWWASVIIYILLMFTAIIWNAAFPSYFPPIQ